MHFWGALLFRRCLIKFSQWRAINLWIIVGWKFIKIQWMEGFIIKSCPARCQYPHHLRNWLNAAVTHTTVTLSRCYTRLLRCYTWHLEHWTTAFQPTHQLTQNYYAAKMQCRGVERVEGHLMLVQLTVCWPWDSPASKGPKVWLKTLPIGLTLLILFSAYLKPLKHEHLSCEDPMEWF